MGHFSIKWVYDPWPHHSYNTTQHVIKNSVDKIKKEQKKAIKEVATSLEVPH